MFDFDDDDDEEFEEDWCYDAANELEISFHALMDPDICGRESDCDQEDKEFWDRELGRTW